MNRIYLIEDHDEALKVWREKKIKNLDLVHLDAHIDFGIHSAKPIEKIINNARSLKELKRNLEYSLSYTLYEKDFDKQTNIGNYIYPAMEQGIVKDFYWVIPGGLKEFNRSAKFIKNILKNLPLDKRQRIKIRGKSGIASTNLLGRKFVICTLGKLPILETKVLLDIDTDFLVIDSVLNADNATDIGKRKPWILPQELAGILKKKIKQPQIITIAYSVNGGYTPIKYKHLGDEIAFLFRPIIFRKRFESNRKAARYFDFFCITNKKEYYWRAIKLNPTYRVADNNYGPLYLSLRKFSLAKKEFLKILSADLQNPACLLGLGNIALAKKDFQKAKRYFTPVLNSRSHRLFTPLERSFLTGFTKIKNQSLFGLARAEIGLKNFKRAKELLVRYQAVEPLQPQSYYLLGRILEKEKDFSRAVTFYKDALRLGLGNIEPIQQLLKILLHFKYRDDNLRFVIKKFKEFKNRFLKTKGSSLKKGKIKSLCQAENKIRNIEKTLKRRVEQCKKQ